MKLFSALKRRYGRVFGHSAGRQYEVVVGNIGTVYSGESKAVAFEIFDGYVKDSKRGFGRASGESVTLMCDGEPIKEYEG